MRSTSRWPLLPFALRILIALSTRTFSQPDEFFQSLEIAHERAFGYGFITWEWRRTVALRSPLYIKLFELLYRSLPSDRFLVMGPKLLQGTLAALADIATVRLTAVLLGSQYCRAALVLSLTSFFHAFALSRTLSNSIETVLTVAALALWPWHLYASTQSQRSSLTASLLIAAVAAFLRPSNGIIWIVLLASLLYLRSDLNMRHLAIAGAVAGAAYAACTISDTLFYGRLTLTPLNFFMFNVYEGVSLFYGVNHALFYATQALPVMLLVQVIYLVRGLAGPTSRALKSALTAMSTMLVVLSFLPHKEVRFAHPTLPLLHVIAARGLGTNVRRRTVVLLALTGLGPALYLNLFHCRGQVEVMDYLRDLPSDQLKGVGFLMPCHSTPWMSHLHQERLANHSWFITCEPPILGQDKASYQDESDFFYRDPAAFLRDRFPATVDPSFPSENADVTGAVADWPADHDLGWRHEWPSHLVMFDALLSSSDVASILTAQGYRESHRIWSSVWHDDPRRKGDVVVWRFEGH